MDRSKPVLISTWQVEFFFFLNDFVFEEKQLTENAVLVPKNFVYFFLDVESIFNNGKMHIYHYHFDAFVLKLFVHNNADLVSGSNVNNRMNEKVVSLRNKCRCLMMMQKLTFL